MSLCHVTQKRSSILDQYQYAYLEDAYTVFEKLESETNSAVLADSLAHLEARGWKVRMLANQTNLKDYQIRHLLRVAKGLSASVKTLLHEGSLSFGHCRVLAGLPYSKQLEVAKECIHKSWSVRHLEAIRQGSDFQEHEKLKSFYGQLSEKFSEVVGHPTQIRPNKGDHKKGTLTLSYSSLEEFDAICHRLRVDIQGLM